MARGTFGSELWKTTRILRVLVEPNPWLSFTLLGWCQSHGDCSLLSGRVIVKL